MSLPIECKTAEQFNTIMMEIWDGALHHLYDEYHNAQIVIAFYKIKRDHNSRLHPGGDVYLFQNGSRCFVNKAGDAIEPIAPIKRR